MVNSHRRLSLVPLHSHNKPSRRKPCLGCRSFQKPPLDVELYEIRHRLPYLLQILEHPAVDDLILQDAEEPLHHPACLGLFQKGEAGSHPPGPDLLLEMVREVLAAVVDAQ